MADTDTSTGIRLRAARHRLGVTQKDAARLSGMLPQQFYSYEIRGKLASLDVLHRIALAIGADPHEIDPRLSPKAEAGVRTLTLVFSGADPERPALAGRDPEDDELVRELVTCGRIGRNDLAGLIQAALQARVKLVIRTDLAPRVVAPEGPASHAVVERPPKKGGRRRPA